MLRKVSKNIYKILEKIYKKFYECPALERVRKQILEKSWTDSD